MENFYTLLSNTGINAIIAARASNSEVKLTKIAVGDGDIIPSQDMTALKSEKHRFNINSIIQDIDNPNYLIVEGVIPSNVGGFYVSEVAIYTDQNTLFAIGSLPKTYKPLLEEGSAKDLTIKIFLEVTNADNVTLKVDDSVVLATRKFVLSELKKYALINGDETKRFKVADAVEPNEAINKKQLNEATNRIGLYDVGYEAKPYHIIAFGGEFNRAHYPKLWVWLQGKSFLKTETEWQAEALANDGICGFYSSGNGTTTFRVPNIDEAFLRPSSRGVGSYQSDAIRNIIGTSFWAQYGFTEPGSVSGAFKAGPRNLRDFMGAGGYASSALLFDASLVVPTANENRPKNIAILPLIVAK
ncbi:phage tail protein [Aliarcobacter cryaerophilus]|uniref:phage tail protein n=1 Tax=Aliarcobacter cryaerophilus TaxID=28198 RepID=UPI0016545F09|nr:phage tail protein [Aliarcobacter cryaerophilus]QNM92366.1 phage tail protein [Aliarcobacter cryaerophilus]